MMSTCLECHKSVRPVRGQAFPVVLYFDESIGALCKGCYPLWERWMHKRDCKCEFCWSQRAEKQRFYGG